MKEFNKIDNKLKIDHRIDASIAALRNAFIVTVFVFLVLLCNGTSSALEPEEILIIANQNSPESRQIASYYCKERGVPEKNILELPLGKNLKDTIKREDYENQLAEPIRREFQKRELLGKIKCLLTVYGVPFKVGSRGILTGQDSRLKELKVLAEQQKKIFELVKQEEHAGMIRYEEAKERLAKLQLNIDYISGKETHASVDSELSMVLFNSYELYRWQPNPLKNDIDEAALKFRPMMLMVSRLDGPSDTIAKGLVDKAIAAEKSGLKGTACFDSRGIVKNDTYGQYDFSLRDLAAFTRSDTNIPVLEDQRAGLFESGSCPEVALYCGWYSVKKYIDAFDFVNGAIGYHIASFEAVSLRDPNSSQWCPSLLMDGITSTLGPVAEPYLHTFPEPKAFFMELYKGKCLVEAYYCTKPFNSWQFLLVGDPLYRPFKNSPLK